MSRRDLRDDGTPIDLGGQCVLRAPGLRGWALRHEPAADATRGAPPRGAIDDALDQADVRLLETIEIAASETAAPPAADVRGPRDEPALELRVPDLGEGVGQVVLHVNEGGAASWHFPLDDGNEIEPSATRGGDGKDFRIPRAVAPADGAADRGTRGLGAIVGRRLLKVLAYPIADRVLGPITRHFAHRWEERSRPDGVRWFRPDGFDAPAAAAWGDDDWRALAAGPALLFVHGTFSRAHSGFAGLPRDLLAELDARYAGRVAAFEHRTLGTTPAENVAWLHGAMPAALDGDLEVDVVCHSRGGLVARALAAAAGPVRVRRIVFVAAPNAGTPLADAAHMVQMIDRYTNLATVLAPEIVGDVLEGVLALVKLVGHAGLVSLPGLAAMDPGGAYLRELGGTETTARDAYAIAADYEPGAGGLASVVKSRIADGVMDAIFRDDDNDLVVPTRGVAESPTSGAFPIADDRRLLLGSAEAVHHGAFFAHPRVAAALRAWLAP